MLLRLRIVVLLAILFEPIASICQVDPAFLPKIPDYATIFSTAAQQDGKLLVCGLFNTVDGNQVQGLARLNLDGSLDQSFKPVLPERISMYSLAVDKDGKILIGGTINEAFSSKGVLQRLNADGTVDPSFNVQSDFRYIVKILPLANGNYVITHAAQGYLSRLKSDGSVDATFNPGTGPNGVTFATQDLAETPDGKILVSGTFTAFNNQPAAGLVRLNQNGSIDNTFSIGSGPAIAESEYYTMYPHISEIETDGDKIIVVGGFSSFNSSAAKNIVRLNANGSVDTSFPTPGPAGNFFERNIEAVAIHSGGLVLGGFDYTDQYRYKFMKLKLDGTLDTSFPTVTTDLSANVNGLNGPRITASSARVYIAAPFDTYGAVKARGLVALNATGNVDESFKANVEGRATVNTLKRLSDGSFLVGGAFNHVGKTFCNNVAKINADGSVDAAFAAALGNGFNRAVNCIEVQADGKIVVAGTFDKFNLAYKNLIVRLNSDGSIDNTFNPSSIAQKYVGIGINAMHLLPSGKILVGGGLYFYTGMTQYNNMARLNSDGSLDMSFNLGILPEDHHVNSIGIRADGQLLIAGAKYPFNGGFIRQLTTEGAVTNTFSTVDLTTDIPQKIRIYDGDKFLVSARVNNFSLTKPNAIMQFSADGNLIDRLSLATYEGFVTSFEPMPNDYFLIGGNFTKVNGVPRRGFAKVKLNGSIDSQFDFALDGGVQNFVRDETPSTNKIFVMGSFTTFAQIKTFGLVNLDLDKQLVSPPSNLAFTLDNEEGKVILTWTDNSSDETGFSISRTEAGATVSVGAVAQQIATFTDITALPQKQYQYKITAVSATSQSVFSNAVEVSTTGWVPPNAPAAFAFDIADDFLTTRLSWDNLSNEKGYEIERSIEGATFAMISETGKDVTSFLDEFFFETSVRYRIRAFNKFGKSEFSTIAELPVILGVEETERPSVSASPNPTQGNVRLTRVNSGAFKAQVYAGDGRMIKEIAGAGEHADISMEKFPNGIYVIKVFGEHDIAIVRVTKF